MESNQSETREQVSFRGQPIPQVKHQVPFTETSCQEVVDKLNSMPNEQKWNVTIEAVHYSNGDLADVRLSTGDIVSTETAIALAGNSMLKGYSTGVTTWGGRTLRSKPDPKNHEVKGIHYLPEF